MEMGVFGVDNKGDDLNRADQNDIEVVEEVQSTNSDPNEGQGQPSAFQEDPEQSQEAGQSQQAEPEPEHELDPSFGGRFKSPEDLAKSYRELEKLKGQQGNRIGQLESKLAEAAQVIQQMHMQMQALAQQQAMVRRPNAPMPQQQPIQQQDQQNIDPEKWIEQFYENPIESIRSILRAELTEEGKALGVALQQVIAPMQQYVAREVTAKELNKRYMQAQQSIPDFEELRMDAADVIEEAPQLAVMPGGLIRAFEIARGRRNQMQFANQPQQPMPNPKDALRIPSSSGSRPGQQKTYEDYVRESVFGSDRSTRGVFD